MHVLSHTRIYVLEHILVSSILPIEDRDNLRIETKQ